jgi:tetratricopeptide (TPR) repeat protein
VQIIEVTGFAVRSAVIRLQHRDTPLEFVLYPMIHVGSASFYAQVQDRLRSADLVVAEGVTPGERRGSLLLRTLTLSYEVLRFNRRAGLVEQDLDYDSLGIPVINPDVNADAFLRAWRRIGFVYRLALWCVLPFIVLAQLVWGSQRIWTKAVEVSDLPSDEEEDLAEVSPEMEEAFLGERDRRLLAALLRLHEERGTEALKVAVVYGAGHVPAIVHGLREHGYRARLGDWLTVVDLVGTPAKVAAPAEPHRNPVADQSRPGATKTRVAAAPASARTPPASRAPIAHGPGVAPAPRRPANTRIDQAARRTGIDELQRKVVRLRAFAEQEPDDNQAELVQSLLSLSDRLADAGRAQEALDAADEAVDLAEDLQERFGASYQTTAAWAAYTLAKRLRDVGEAESATALYAEAVELMRSTHRHDPYRRAKDLGTSLTDYALHLARRGQHEQAVAIGTEAVELFRAANTEVRGEFARPWALAQRNIAAALGELGRHEEALDAARRAVNLARAAHHPPTLVECLRALSFAYRDLNRTEEALSFAHQCVDAARAADPSSVDDALGLALDLLASTLSWAQQRREAVPVAAEAVAAWRLIAAASPGQLSSLAKALSVHGFHQWRVGADDFGLASADEAERIARWRRPRRRCASTGPGTAARSPARSVIGRLCSTGQENQRRPEPP